MPSFAEQDFTYANGEKKLHYISAGPEYGELIIFLHGWPLIAKTWHHQLTACAEKGYRVVAPDMPGYGGSTARKVQTDYAQENIVAGMLEFLQHLGRKKAIWVAHDWGSCTLWSLARSHPEVCIAVCSLGVPFAISEFGTEEALKYADRDLYPEDKYKWSQWSYQVYYDEHFEEATEWFEKDIRGILKTCFIKSDPSVVGKPSFTSQVAEEGGWFGGAPKPPSAADIPDEAVFIDKETFEELAAAMEKTGFWPANAWYINHKANTAFNESGNGRNFHLTFPVLFIESKYDVVCDTANSRLGEPQEKLCDDLTFVSIAAGHFVCMEKPTEVNEALIKWLTEKVDKLSNS